jgi:hypothetical protein
MDAEGKVIGDWLRDKTISWKARRRLLQTNTGVFPCVARLQKWGKHTDGICELCKRAERWVLSYWGEDPLGTPPGICRTACVASKLQRLQGLTIRVFNGCKMT